MCVSIIVFWHTPFIACISCMNLNNTNYFLDSGCNFLSPAPGLRDFPRLISLASCDLFLEYPTATMGYSLDKPHFSRYSSGDIPYLVLKCLLRDWNFNPSSRHMM